MARTIEDAVFLIRDWTSARGCAAHRMLSLMANDARGIADYDETHPAHRTSFGEMIGGTAYAVAARKAARQYRLAAWVCRMIYDGREAYDQAVALATEASEAARIATLPRVNAWGR